MVTVKTDTKKKSLKNQLLWAFVGALIVTGGLMLFANFYNSSPQTCTELARDMYSGDGKFVETHMTNGSITTGTVEAYKSGSQETVTHWECTMESGEPKMTFEHAAG